MLLPNLLWMAVLNKVDLAYLVSQNLQMQHRFAVNFETLSRSKILLGQVGDIVFQFRYCRKLEILKLQIRAKIEWIRIRPSIKKNVVDVLGKFNPDPDFQTKSRSDSTHKLVPDPIFHKPNPRLLRSGKP